MMKEITNYFYCAAQTPVFIRTVESLTTSYGVLCTHSLEQILRRTTTRDLLLLQH